VQKGGEDNVGRRHKSLAIRTMHSGGLADGVELEVVPWPWEVEGGEGARFGRKRFGLRREGVCGVKRVESALGFLLGGGEVRKGEGWWRRHLPSF